MQCNSTTRRTYIDIVKVKVQLLSQYCRNMFSSLNGKIAFVTGAASGIGKATSQTLAKEGATIIAADVTSCTQMISELPGTGHECYHLDVTESRQIQQVIREILSKKNKLPNIVVNSAGILKDCLLLKMQETDFDKVMSINLKAFARELTQAPTPCSIINVSSIVGRHGNIGQSNYAASKAAVESLTKTAAKELGKYDIRVNCIVPGIITTPMTDNIPPKIKEKFLSQIPLGRYGTPEDIANLISFLASDKSSYITGASMEITGGLWT